jgi:hypothetical protein
MSGLMTLTSTSTNNACVVVICVMMRTDDGQCSSSMWTPKNSFSRKHHVDMNLVEP